MSQSSLIPQRAVELFEQGYNCAQAVFGAFAEEMGMTEKQAVKMVSALGGGLCRMRETCGAVTGGMMALGVLRGYDDPQSDETKMALYARGQRMLTPFKEKFGTFTCKELLDLPMDGALSPIPTPRTAKFYQERPCARFVYEMAKLVEEEIHAEETDGN